MTYGLKTLLLVSSFKTIDLHYQYAKKEFSVSIEVEEKEKKNGERKKRTGSS